MLEWLRADNFRWFRPTPVGCVVFLLSVLLFVIGILAVCILVMRPGPALESNHVIAGLVCVPVSMLGFWLSWRLLRSPRRLDRHGPGLQ
ncbi:MAG: hypothetical protein ACYSU0_07830 [Planctomycetota bacterium]|jgi:hypothetical protein